MKADLPIFPNTFPKSSLLGSVSVREDVLYANHAGQEKARIRERAQNRMRKLEAPLQKLLAKDEVVFYTAGAGAPMNALETYTLGYAAQRVSRVTLVFTQKRILAFRVDGSGNWRSSVRGCGYADISSLKVGGLLARYLQLRFSSGKKITYGNMSRAETKALSRLLPILQQAAAGQASGVPEMLQYCPTCASVLTPRVYECGTCHQLFRSESSLWWRALIPGGAYFYAKQSGLGVLHAIVDFILTLDLLLVAITLVSGFWTGRLSGPDLSGAVVGFVYLFVVTALEKLIAVYHARRFIREFIPVEGTSREQKAQTASSFGSL